MSLPVGAPPPLPSPAATSPEVLAGWDALRFGTNGNLTNGWVPPDVILSAGPNHVVEMVNLLMGVYTKTGTQVKLTGLASFFGSGGDFISDPKVQYDADSGRWFVTLTDVTATQVLLAVSASSDPTGTWHLYRVPSAATGACLDQPILGVGTTTVIISVNVYTQTKSAPCTSPYLGAQYWVINKNDLVTGAASPAIFASTPDVTEFSIHPVQVEGSSTVHYMVATFWPGTATSSNTLNLFTVTGTPPGTVTVTLTAFTMPTAAVPPAAPQANSARTLDTGDIRVADAVWSNGRLWLGFDEQCVADATRACIRLMEIDTAAGSLLQDFDLTAAGRFVFYPGLRVDGAGSLAVAFGYSSSTDYPGVMATGRVFGDALNTLQDPEVIAPGSGPESPGGCVQTCRYGDYFGAALDPTNASVVWMGGEMGTPTGWSTHVFAVSVKTQLTLSYRLAHAGGGYSPPVVTYVHGGVAAQSSFSTTPTTALADPGTTWSVSAQLAGSNVSRGEVWVVNATPGTPARSGWANASLTRTFDYFHQYFVSFGFRVVGGGGYAIAPQLNGTSFGLPVIITTPESRFLDAGTPYAYPTLLSGSSGTERWRASSSGAANVSRSGNVSLTYYHQVLMTFLYAVQGASLIAPVRVGYAYLGGTTVSALNATVWADAQAAYAYDAAIGSATPGVRWGAGPNGNGTVATSTTVTVTYREQFYVSVATDPAVLASSVAGGGWYNVGAAATLTVTPPAGWRFHAWGGDASGAATTTTVSVVHPLNVTASFDAGLTIVAGDGGAIAYAYGSASGTVPAGSSTTIYVPAGTTVTLTASPSSWSQEFLGWSGATTGSATSTPLHVSAPATVTGTFGLNLVFVGGISLLVVLVILGVVVVLVVRRGRSRPPA